MRRLVSNALWLGVLALAGCEPPPSADGAAVLQASEVGSVAFELTLGGGFKIGTVHYDINGNGFHAAADVNVGNSTTFKTVVGGIPFGNGYAAKLTLADVDHRLLPCQGTAMFSVGSAATVPVPVHLACKEVPTGPPPPPVVPVPRSATLALGALLLALGWRRARRAATRSPIVLLALAATGSLSLAVAGCDAGTDAPSASSSDIGAVTMALDISPGTTLNAVDYLITGPGTFMKAGTIDVSLSSMISTVISPLPPGAGFQIELRATSLDGNARCLGAAGFDIASRTTTNVLVHLLCQQMPHNGIAYVNGALNACPLIDSFAASPGEVFVGASIGLAATAHDVDNAPSPLGYQWSATTGTLSDVASANPQFTCTSAGLVTLTLTVSDGDLAPGCADTRTLMLVCTAP
jgi:hypothetical protein